MNPSRQFKIVYAPDAKVNQFMRGMDLMQHGEGIYTEQICTVTWKKGEKITKARVARTAANIKKAIELSGGEVASITEIVERRLE